MLTQFSITPTGAAIIASPAPEPQIKPVKFDAAFLERRMREHRQLVRELQREHELEIVRRWVGRAQ